LRTRCVVNGVRGVARVRGAGGHLQRLGWSFHRLWSTNWFHNSPAEVAKLKDAYERAVAAADVADPEPEPPSADPPAAEASAAESPAAGPPATEAAPGHDLDVIGRRDVSPRRSP
jgi:hypothetical protein